MDYDAYTAAAQQAASLVDQGDYPGAATILQGLVESDISDLDKAMMCLNLATVHDRMNLPDEALQWFARGEGLERRHGRFHVAEQLAAHLAATGRDCDSLRKYEDLLRRRELMESDKVRIRNNVEVLRRRLSPS
jgi:predicted negative regulator of RcsB-dependent stress response